MAVAKIAFEEAAAEGFHDIADDDGFGRTGERVTALLTAGRLDEATLAKDAQDLRGISRRDTFGLADFGNGQTLCGKPGVTETNQTAQTVLFVCGQFHRFSLAIGMISSSPSASLAASDIRSLDHGGSNVSSSLTSVTPGTARTARSASPGRVPATGQFGAVRVIRRSTLPFSSTAQS